MNHNGDKDKDKKKKSVKMGEWKKTKKVKQPDGSWKITSERAGSSPGSQKKMPNEQWKKFLKDNPNWTAPPKAKKETKEEIIRPMKKLATRSTPLKPVTSKRKLTKVPTPTTPPTKKSKPIYAKKRKAPDRTWSPGKKGLKGLTAATGGALIGKGVRKDRTGYHVGTKVKQSTTRPVSEKRAGEKGVVEANLGSEKQKAGQKRTASGLAKKKTMKGKRY